MHGNLDYKILWIEDDTDIIGYVINPLKKRGITFKIIESKKEFLTHKNNLTKYDLIMVDLIIPQMTKEEFVPHPGLDILTIIRDELKIDIPIIVFTVVQKEEEMEKLKKFNIYSVLNKPVKRAELTTTVLSALGEKIEAF
jgi:CheY-like chemotaxis protein